MYKKLIKKYKRQVKQWDKDIDKGIFDHVRNLISKRSMLIDVISDLENLANEQTRTDHSDRTEQKALHIADVVRSLPSDDEIEKVADDKIFISSVKRKYSSIYSEGFEDGAKWIKQKIVNS